MGATGYVGIKDNKRQYYRAVIRFSLPDHLINPVVTYSGVTGITASDLTQLNIYADNASIEEPASPSNDYLNCWTVPVGVELKGNSPAIYESGTMTIPFEISASSNLTNGAAPLAKTALLSINVNYQATIVSKVSILSVSSVNI